MQTPPRTPSPLALPPVQQYLGAPIKNGNNPNYIPIGNIVAINLGPTFDRVNDERYTTPPRQRAVPRNMSPKRKKK